MGDSGIVADVAAAVAADGVVVDVDVDIVDIVDTDPMKDRDRDRTTNPLLLLVVVRWMPSCLLTFAKVYAV